MRGDPCLRCAFLLVSDNFYDKPLSVLRVARCAEYFEPRDITGYRTTTVYHPGRIRRRLEQVLGLRITRWDAGPADDNGVFYVTPAAGRMRERPAVHYDEPETDLTVLIYLTPGVPANCGTSLWRHRPTGLKAAPTSSDARRLGVALRELRDEMERDARRRTKWVEVARVDYKFNRLVAFPSRFLHSATHHFGRSVRDARIYQAFRLGTDLSSFHHPPRSGKGNRHCGGSRRAFAAKSW